MSIFGQKSLLNFKKDTTQKTMFQEILNPGSKRIVRKKSKLIDRVEKDRNSKRKEIDTAKVDPLNILTPSEINEYASLGLEMFQNSLKLCSSDSDFKTVIRNITRLNLGKYLDETFQPCLHSLVGDNLINRTPWRAFVWLQPHQISKNKKLWKFGENGVVSPDDVRQGLIGDGYLIAALASLAEKPERIKKLFASDENDINFGKEHGVYAVHVYSAGHPFEIVLDDWFPCISESKGSAFAQNVDYKLWPMMIEKAWAKLYYSYDNMEGGMSKNVLRDLTGAPVKVYWTDEDDKVEHIWQQLKKGSENKWPMTSATKEFNHGIDFINEVGLISDHVYSLLGGVEVNTSAGPIRLVKLRTVCPDAIWKGKWSIESETKEWEKVADRDRYLNELTEKTFVFFIEFSEFRQYFENFQVCEVNDEFKYSFQTQKFNRKRGQYFKITIKEAGKYYFTLSQDDLKKYSKSYREKYNLANVTMIIGRKVAENKYEYIASMNGDNKDVNATNNLEGNPIPPGEYILYVKVLWEGFEEKEATISVYGPGKVRIDEELEFIQKSFLENVFLDFASKSKKRESLKEDGAPNSYFCAEKTLHGFAFIVVWNRESDKKMKCEFRVKNLKEFNLKLKAKFSGVEIATFEIGPGEADICLIRVKKYKEYGEESNDKLYYSKNVRLEYV